MNIGGYLRLLSNFQTTHALCIFAESLLQGEWVSADAKNTWKFETKIVIYSLCHFLHKMDTYGCMCDDCFE